jgi:dipeptidyl aminopeptidase/acylaminoacyl peptidase
MGGSHDNPNSPESKLIGGALQENKEKAAKANPIAYVSRDDPPFLILHGDKDGAVPFSQSELLVEALTKAGVEATLVPLKGAGHGGPAFAAPEMREKIVAFFSKHLKPKE